MASLIRRIRELASRVTGFSTPLFGLSWKPGELTETKPDALGDSPVLTPGECAQVLRVDQRAVIDLLESGHLRGLSVAGEWRVTSSQLAEFLHEQSRAKALEVLARRISDPKVWAAELRGQPEMMKEIQTGEYPEDSFGKFLQHSLKILEEDVKEIQEARFKAPEDDRKTDAVLALEEKPATEATVQKADVYSLESIPEWRRKEIEEWLQPIAGFKPIPLGEGLARTVQYPDVVVPFQKPRFGRDRIPFELNIQETDRFIKGVEHAPRRPTDTERSQEITPGARNVTAVYALVTSGNARRIVENFEFEDLRIGYLEFYLEDEAPFAIELVLGKNIRDWSYKDPDVVQVVVDRSVEQVWRDSKDEATIDMLKIIFPNVPCNVKYCQICAHIEGVPASYKHTYPSIRLSGLTYRLA